MRRAYELHRLQTANSGTHDFPDTAALAVWWAQNGSTAGVSVYHKLVVVESLEAVYPTMTPPAPPSGVLPAMSSAAVTLTKYAWGTTPPQA